MGVLGVDACRRGWVGIVLVEEAPIVGVFSSVLSDLVLQAAQVADLEAIGIDMPIGLPDSGRRAADVLARSYVGPRRQSVFMTPVRAALAEESHSAASLRNKDLAGEGISQQAYALRPRLFEVDAWVATSQIPVVEIHPEVSFATLATWSRPAVSSQGPPTSTPAGSTSGTAQHQWRWLGQRGCTAVVSTAAPWSTTRPIPCCLT